MDKSRNRNYSWFFLVLTTVCACTSPSKNKADLLDQVVLIIDKCPDYSGYRNEQTDVYSYTADDFEITSVNSDLVKQTYKTNRVPTRDTIVFKSKDDFLEVDHIYKFHRYVSYLFQKGDTVLFTYEDDFPRAEILNREVNEEEVNYESIRNDYLLNDGEEFDGVSKFNIHPMSSVKGFLAIRDRKKSSEIRKDMMADGLKQSKVELEKEQVLLDSLFTNRLISDNTKEYYLQKANTQYQFNEYRFNTFLTEKFGDSEMNLAKWEIKNSPDGKYTTCGYYSRILKYIEREAFYSNVNWIEEVNMRYPDYRIVYDSIRANQFLTKGDKDLLLSKNIQLIIEHFSVADVDSYFAKYVGDIENADLIESVVAKYEQILSAESMALSNYVNNNSGETFKQLSLVDKDGSILDFRDLLNEHKGKLVYVDFWASHCVPCYVAMPHSKEMIENYEGQPIAFVYISIDKDVANWHKGQAKAGISDYHSSYMVNEGNSERSLIEALEINEIPRYLLFDQAGKLIQYRAFGPSTPEIRETIDRYIN